ELARHGARLADPAPDLAHQAGQARGPEHQKRDHEHHQQLGEAEVEHAAGRRTLRTEVAPTGRIPGLSAGGPQAARSSLPAVLLSLALLSGKSASTDWRI